MYGRKPHWRTVKEPDSETGLYYYGARYLDPKTSRWLSGDPAMSEYVPSAPVNDEARRRNGSLPGQGGVFNYVNLHVYHYAGNNPVKYVDPDGEALWIPLIIAVVASLVSQSCVKPSNETNPNDVVALNDGTVSLSGWQNPNNHNEGMGWRTRITRDNGQYDQYGHLDPTSTLPTGTRVNRGDVIGRMADPTNGQSTGPHVHVETRDSTGTPVAPTNESPFRSPSRITSPYQAQEPGLRAAPHTGVDHVPDR